MGLERYSLNLAGPPRAEPKAKGKGKEKANAKA